MLGKVVVEQELGERSFLPYAALFVNHGWDVDAEGRAISKTTGEDIDLRLDWDSVQRQLAQGMEPQEQELLAPDAGSRRARSARLERPRTASWTAWPTRTVRSRTGARGTT